MNVNPRLHNDTKLPLFITSLTIQVVLHVHECEIYILYIFGLTSDASWKLACFSFRKLIRSLTPWTSALLTSSPKSRYPYTHTCPMHAKLSH